MIEPSQQQSKTIVMLDDSEIVLELATKKLGQAGYVVRAAADLATFEQHCKLGDFDLIVLDLNMPELFGDDIGSMLRNIRGIDTPIYLFSSAAPAELATRVAEAGIDGFVSKNDGMKALVERVQAILG